MQNTATIFLLILASFGCLSLSAQDLLVHLTDGSTKRYPVEDISGLTFEHQELVVSQHDGSKTGWSLAEVSSYQYEQPAAVNTKREKASLDINLYPNPVSRRLNIEFRLQQKEEITVEIRDASGALAETLFENSSKPGKELLIWDISASPNVTTPGVYFCIISIGNKSYSRAVVIQ